MTIQEALKSSTEKLKEIYEEGEAAAISELVIEKLTGLRKSARSSDNKKELSSEQEAQLNSYLQSLMTHEPVQYVLQESWFCGLKFYVDKNVLIPRPETEELVEWIIANCKFPVDELTILDIGSGSGCIPITLKRRIRKAEVWSGDISEGALKVARHNAASLGADVNFIQLDFLNEKERNKLASFDIIVSNPPYVPEKDKHTMHPNVLKYEPATALFVPDNDALVFYRAIADFGKEKLNPGGSMYMEIHESLGADVVKLFEENGYTAELKKDMQGKDRMIAVRKAHKAAHASTSLSIKS